MKSELSPQPDELSSAEDWADAAQEGHDWDEEELVGHTLDGRYLVGRKLGEGAMGVVFRGVHLGLGEPIAIKFIRRGLRTRRDVHERFALEARICMRIQSEHVVKVLDVNRLDPFGPYMVMEYVEGTTIADLLGEAPRGRFPLVQILDYAFQVCEGLAVAHAQDVVHNDIKPENLIVTRQGERRLVKILDFGVARTTPVTTPRRAGQRGAATRWAAGTPAYMAPERILGHKANPASDLWSVGTLLYEMATGQPAYAGDSAMAIGRSVREGEAPVLPRVEGMSEEEHESLSAAIARCLRRDPRERFQDTAELTSALASIGGVNERAGAERIASIAGRSARGPDPGSDATQAWTWPETSIRVAQEAESAQLQPLVAGVRDTRRRRGWPLWAALAAVVGVSAAFFMIPGPNDPTSQHENQGTPSSSAERNRLSTATRALGSGVTAAVLSPSARPDGGSAAPLEQTGQGGSLDESQQPPQTDDESREQAVQGRLQPAAPSERSLRSRANKRKRRARKMAKQGPGRARTRALRPARSSRAESPQLPRPRRPPKPKAASLVLVPSEDTPTLPLVPTLDDSQGTGP